MSSGLNDSKDKEEEEPSNNQKSVNTSLKVTAPKKRRLGSWQRGCLRPSKKKKKEKLSPDNDEEEEKVNLLFINI